MYDFSTRTRKAEKQFRSVLETRTDIKDKLLKLQEDPRAKLNAHPLKGKLSGLWSCYLGYDIRLIYKIDDDKKEIVIFAAGSHKQAYR